MGLQAPQGGVPGAGLPAVPSSLRATTNALLLCSQSLTGSQWEGLQANVSGTEARTTSFTASTCAHTRGSPQPAEGCGQGRAAESGVGQAEPGQGRQGGVTPPAQGAASQKQCKKSSFAFYQAVRDLLPVWFLEDMRTMEAFHWEDGGKVSAYSPSEALLYALVHDHQPYARHLLTKFPQSALAVPSQNFSCCQSSAPHLAMAVRYNRARILFRILKAIQAFPPSDRAGHLDRRGCSRVEGGKTALHVACELVRPECLLLLLGHGASPCLQDSAGNTPLDTLLEQISHMPAANMRAKLLCLDCLFFFVPQDLQFSMKQQLLDNRQQWQDLLGENRFQCLVGLAPPSLFVGAMRVLIRTISPEHFPEALDDLPLPHFLKPLDLKLES
uniref:Ankyrin repeat domain-containing protein 9 n=1 Tax=Athene cunicularia TaxID=194338 RepID=A0A663M1E0_ATHCN